MTSMTASNSADLVAALLFILSLAGLSQHRTSRAGVVYGIAGMALALVATIVVASQSITAGAVALILVAMAIGAGIGLWRARSVEMTQMPELIAVLHSFVGLAAVLVGWNSYLEVESHGTAQTRIAADLLGIHHAEVFIGIFIGAVTFTGSIVAFLKLSARINSRPLMLPGKNGLNLGALAAFVALTVWFTITPNLPLMIVVTVLALALGWHLVASIGGGDMPVVVSMLNSYSGWAAAAAGFLLDNNLLIVTGALVGSSGAYLSYIMCKAMNRSFVSVIAGGFGIQAPSGTEEEQGEHREVRAEEVAELLATSHSVVITPGCGAHASTARARRRGPLRRPPRRRPSARAHERAARRGEGAVRRRPGDGRDQRRLRRHLGRAGHRRERHGQPGRDRGPEQPDRRHAGAAGLGGGERRRLQALHGIRLRGRAEPAVLPREQQHALRRREGERRGDPARAQHGRPP
jgi:NAD(P) transhydrogenase subunit beta